ncbi:hypothetical protein F5Y16DRAFT_407616 [Xylariaceae sp. FL0255]|nr:hypothetical protein F5Y16DRAFT_407616 [Xylariaceae sp. FL0255]
MPSSNLPSSFASAAAGQNASRETRSGPRSDGRGNGSGEWPRQGRSTNGTLTLRRTSTTPSSQAFNQPSAQDPAGPEDPAVIAAMPVGSTVVESAAPQRYSRDDLLSIYNNMPGQQQPDVSALFVPGWNPGHANGQAARGWGKPGDSHVVPQDPETCWDAAGSSKAFGLQEMNSDEKEIFSTDVNSTMKPPTQNKEAPHPGGAMNGRKTSFSHGTSGNAYGLASPSTASRPGTRRRETTDTNPFSGGGGGLVSPVATGRPPRDPSSFWTDRKTTEPIEEPEDESESRDTGAKINLIGGASRTNTTTSASGFGGGASIWPSSSANSLSGLGSFGNFALPGSNIGEKRTGAIRGESRLAHLIPRENIENSGRPADTTDRSWRPRPRTDTDPFGDEGRLVGSAVLGGALDDSPPPMSHLPLHTQASYDTPVKGSAGDFGMAGLNLGGNGDHEQAPLSPSETNPYRSPPAERGEQDESGDRPLGFGAGEPSSGFPRPFPHNAFDGTHPTLGNLSGWPSSGTPDRERAPFGGFGGSLFGQMGDMQSPGLGNLGGVFGPGTGTGIGGSGSISRAQMQSYDNDSLRDSIPDLRQAHPLDTESPLKPDRPGFTDIFGHMSGVNPSPAGDSSLQGGRTNFPNTPSEPPSAQARTMVMPDRMRWTYLDPQGRQQGPFTGLQMNEWFKGNFFTNDLRLIRRIGNSREPFLQFAPTPGGGIQPPLPNAFPSFGRTLTAEEQNNLERRKQEEQFFMARHREAYQHQQQQAAMNRMPMQGIPGLNHHSSAHSLHSQPSFGSMTSPISIPPQAPIGPGGSFFDPLVTRQPAAPGENRQGLDIGPERQVLASMHNSGTLGGNVPQQSLGAPSPESGVRNQLPTSTELADDPEGFRGRLQQFEKLRAEHETEQSQVSATQRKEELIANQSVKSLAESQPSFASDEPDQPEPPKQVLKNPTAGANQEFREYQQAQAAAAAAKLSGLPMPFPPPPSGTPLPAPAPQRIRSNLPEQYATSSRSGTPDVSSAMSTQPPPLAPWAKDGSVESHKGPSLKEIQQAEALKAAKAEEAAAQARRNMLEIEAAQERSRQAAVAAGAAPGLPTSSTWGTASPVSAGPVSSPWTKPVAGKGATPIIPTATTASNRTKTLAEIQREEEARKQKAKELALQTGAPASAGKRYADLASKSSSTTPASQNTTNNPAATTVSAGWATVGAGGKVKASPTGPTTQSRSASSTSFKSTPAAVQAPTTRLATKNTSAAVGSGRTEAMDEFMKWIQGQLARGITGVMDIDSFVSILMGLPLSHEIISDAIYAHSKTMDGHHFANEFIRRKKLADKGVVEKQPAPSPSADTQSSSAGGWNEVAKKSNHKEPATESGSIQGGAFKVVPGLLFPVMKGTRLDNTSCAETIWLDTVWKAGEAEVFDTSLSQLLGNFPSRDLLNSFVQYILVGDTSQQDSSYSVGIQHDAIRLGLASLAAFLQANVTGPVLDSSQSAERLFAEAIFKIQASAKHPSADHPSPILTFRLLCQRSLDTDGVSPYPHIPHIELFCLARFLFITSKILPSSDSLAWTHLRIHLWHYKLLTQPSLGPGSLFTKSGRWTDVVTLQGLIETSLAQADAAIFRSKNVETEVWPHEFQVLFRLEEANSHVLLGNDTKARRALLDATKLNGFSYALSGALGKRTRFQNTNVSQLVVLAKSLQLTTNSGIGRDANTQEATPSALPLNDDTLLENIEFSKGNISDPTSSVPAELSDIKPDDQPKLQPIDQIILLTEATLKDTISTSDSLTLEEILPFAVRVIDDKSVNWQIYTQALLVRSRIELNRSRTIERGVLQLQAVADQVIVNTQEGAAPTASPDATKPDVPKIEITSEANSLEAVSEMAKQPTSFLPAPKPTESASPKERLRYINALASPPRWHLESELAYAWTAIGSLVSALEIFKRLRLWPEVALCLASTAASGDEDGRGAGGEEKARAVVRWQLFKETSRVVSEAFSEENIDVDEIKPDNFQGPERSPPPPNAPRLFCILGDLEDNAEHYKRAWEISNHRYARAQRSLGELYLKNKEWTAARQAYQLAVGINRQNPDLWSRLGDIELRLGNFPDSAEAFQRAIGSSNDVSSGEDARTWSNLGSALLSWYREIVQEDKTRKEREKADEEYDIEHMISTKRAADLGRSASQLLRDALLAFKRGATLAHTNWRIWDNVVTLAASLTPIPAFDDLILGVKNILNIRKTEEVLDLNILTILVREATKSPAPASATIAKNGDGDVSGAIYQPARGSIENKVIALFENDIIPLITTNSAVWTLVSRLRSWRRDFQGALDAAEKGWRSAIGGAGSTLSASSGGAGQESSWLTDPKAWDVVVQRTMDLVAAYENYGPRVESIGESRWKGKARNAVRSVLGKAKEAWEGDDNWVRLQDTLADLR